MLTSSRITGWSSPPSNHSIHALPNSYIRALRGSRHTKNTRYSVKHTTIFEHFFGVFRILLFQKSSEGVDPSLIPTQTQANVKTRPRHRHALRISWQQVQTTSIIAHINSIFVLYLVDFQYIPGIHHHGGMVYTRPVYTRTLDLPVPYSILISPLLSLPWGAARNC